MVMSKKMFSRAVTLSIAAAAIGGSLAFGGVAQASPATSAAPSQVVDCSAALQRYNDEHEQYLRLMNEATTAQQNGDNATADSLRNTANDLKNRAQADPDFQSCDIYAGNEQPINW
ncbi:hypothetical protein ACWEOE_14205 [Amycolatopsis sp. NPDC004368]